MKVAHFGLIRPNLSGQYHTVKDLIKAERMVGIEAEFIDGKTDIIHTDGWLTTKHIEWAKDADIILHHFLIPEEIKQLHKPTIMALHGRPESSFLIELFNTLGVYPTIRSAAQNKDYKAFAYFWPEHRFNWEFLIHDDRLKYIPAPVDTDYFKPEGKRWDFGKNSGKPNIVIADMWREDDTPYNVLHAAAYFQKHMCPEAKVHVFGVPAARPHAAAELVVMFHGAGVVGQSRLPVDNMDEILRSADIVITPHTIATRLVRETLASGTALVAGLESCWTQYRANATDYEGFAHAMDTCWTDVQDSDMPVGDVNRETALCLCSLDHVGNELKKLFEGVLA